MAYSKERELECKRAFESKAGETSAVLRNYEEIPSEEYVRKGEGNHTYPWGANKYFFACDMKRLAQSLAVKMLYKDRRSITHSHEADDIEDLQLFDGYALPLSFCDIAVGESLFRDPIHYFERLSKSIEQNVSIADELKESIQPFTDSELFSAIVGICKIKYGQPRPSLLPPDAKLKMAATMHYDYHAKEKQICRFLNLTPEMVRSVIRF